MKASEILKAAREVISNPEHFTQGHMARDSKGDDCYVRDEKATSFCSLGAFYKVTGFFIMLGTTIENETSYRAQAALKTYMDRDIMYFNDSHDHETVMKAWDLAIKDLESQGF